VFTWRALDGVWRCPSDIGILTISMHDARVA
jgi:hypothetical protein